MVSLMYLSIFVALGLFVSSLTSRSATSLVILLLLWVICVLLIPATFGTILSGLNQPLSTQDYKAQRSSQRKEITERYEARGLYDHVPTRVRPPTDATLLWAQFLNEERRADSRLNKEFLTTRIHQIQVAREFNRVSPTAIVQYAVESLARTGFQRHLDFLKNAERYADAFNDFLISADRADPDSLHVPFVREGMSDKPVSFESIPKISRQRTFRRGIQRRAPRRDAIVALFRCAVRGGTRFISTKRNMITRAYSESRRRTLCVICSTTASPPANPCDQSVVAAVKTVPPCV